MTSPALGSNAVLFPGDLRRPEIGRAVRAALLAAAAFEVFTIATKLVHPIYVDVPWAEDPYDTFVSLALFFVPLAGFVAGTRLMLCRRSEPLPVTRLTGVVRATWLVLAVALATLAADWAGVLLGGRSDGGQGAIAAASALALALTTCVVVAGTIALARVRIEPVDADLPDGIADGLTLACEWADRLGPAGRPLAMVATFADVRMAPLVRRRPVTASALVALAFATALALTSIREDGPSPVVVLVGAVALCAMFAFVVAGGAWLGLVAPSSSTDTHRRLVRAAAAAAAAVPASLAFRDVIWSATGLGGQPGPADVAVLVAAAGAVTFVSVLTVLTLRRHYGDGRATRRLSRTRARDRRPLQREKVTCVIPLGATSDITV